jgi:hypothetical protein
MVWDGMGWEGRQARTKAGHETKASTKKRRKGRKDRKRGTLRNAPCSVTTPSVLYYVRPGIMDFDAPPMDKSSRLQHPPKTLQLDNHYVKNVMMNAIMKLYKTITI